MRLEKGQEGPKIFFIHSTHEWSFQTLTNSRLRLHLIPIYEALRICFGRAWKKYRCTYLSSEAVRNTSLCQTGYKGLCFLIGCILQFVDSEVITSLPIHKRILYLVRPLRSNKKCTLTLTTSAEISMTWVSENWIIILNVPVLLLSLIPIQ